MVFMNTLVELESIPIFGILFSICKIFISIWLLFFGFGTCLTCYDEEEGMFQRCYSTISRAAFGASFIYFIEALINIFTLGFYQFYKQFDIDCHCSKANLCCFLSQNNAEINV